VYKKKVAIISLFHNSQNYGGVLQAFALNKAVENMGYDAFQIDFSNSKKAAAGDKKKELAQRYMKEHSAVQFVLKTIKSIIKRIYVKLQYKSQKGNFAVRRAVFDEFRNRCVAHTKACSIDNIGNICNNFDLYMCGSDQIWKPNVVNDAYMLNFGSLDTPRCAYAASLSVDVLEEQYHDLYKEWLMRFNKVSVREEQAVSLIQPLCQQHVEWVCDPTLLLSAKEWDEVIPKKSDRGYIFCYFLGDTAEHRKVAKKYAKKRNLKIITLPNLQQKPNVADAHFGDEQRYDVSPLEFVSLIKNADCVFTDSFHATAFSLNMQTPFYVFEREAISSMGSRIVSLLEMTGCMNRFLNKASIGDKNDIAIDWNYVSIAIEKQRSHSMDYLKGCLKLIN